MNAKQRNATGNKKMAAKTNKMCDCPKCDGSGKINAFSHYAEGVCFACGGSGEIKVPEYTGTPLTAASEAVAADNAKKAAWIAKATPEGWSRLTWKQIYAARAFAMARPESPIEWPEAAERRYRELLAG